MFVFFTRKLLTQGQNLQLSNQNTAYICHTHSMINHSSKRLRTTRPSCVSGRRTNRLWPMVKDSAGKWLHIFKHVSHYATPNITSCLNWSKPVGGDRVQILLQSQLPLWHKQAEETLLETVTLQLNNDLTVKNHSVQHSPEESGVKWCGSVLMNWTCPLVSAHYSQF